MNVLGPQYQITTEEKRVHVYSVGKELKLSITRGLLPYELNIIMHSLSKMEYQVSYKSWHLCLFHFLLLLEKSHSSYRLTTSTPVCAPKPQSWSDSYQVQVAMKNSLIGGLDITQKMLTMGY